MRIDRFTIKSQEAIEAAQRLAAQRQSPELLGEHLLAVLLEQESSLVEPVLRKVGPTRPRSALLPTRQWTTPPH